MPSTPTTGNTMVGVFNGTSFGTAFTNPQQLDVLQIINEGGNIVWSLNYLGVATVNPTNPTATSVFKRYFGTSVATAWTNYDNLDIIQITNPSGQAVVYHCDYLGTVYQP